MVFIILAGKTVVPVQFQPTEGLFVSNQRAVGRPTLIKYLPENAGAGLKATQRNGHFTPTRGGLEYVDIQHRAFE